MDTTISQGGEHQPTDMRDAVQQPSIKELNIGTVIQIPYFYKNHRVLPNVYRAEKVLVYMLFSEKCTEFTVCNVVYPVGDKD